MMYTVWFPLLLAALNFFVAGMVAVRIYHHRNKFLALNITAFLMNVGVAMFNLLVAYGRLSL